MSTCTPNTVSLNQKNIIYQHDYSQNETIHQIFENQVINNPNNVAITYKDVNITYNHLNQMANQLAHYLKSQYEINSDDLIALYLDKNESMLLAILAVLKAGAAYIPIDSNAPKDRVNYILDDSKARIILTNSRIISIFTKEQPCNYNILAIDDQNFLKNDLSKRPTSNLSSNVTGNNLAYIIYTSGTTGKPKGVLQLHGNVVKLFNATKRLFKFNSNDIWTLFHSYIFDFSIWEIFGALFYGSKLIVVPTNVTKDTELFYALCEKEKVTVLNQTPNAFYNFIDISLKKPTRLNSLRYVIFGGDKLNFRLLAPWFDKYGDVQPQLINMYGITETTIHATYKKISIKDVGDKSYIGKFISNMQGYILNANSKQLPVGEIGELYIAGDGLARGYLNLPKLTKERFITNPYQTYEERALGKNTRLYKTGDLVRYLANGEIEYIGRNDVQIKINGFRIEPGEIEAALTSYPEIKQAVVLAKQNTNNNVMAVSNKYLVGYYVAKKKLLEKDILGHLSNFLPEYMIPNVLVYLDKLPLTTNGKLDKASLLNRDIDRYTNYVIPKNEIEKDLCNIWEALLKIPANKIGIHDNFFKLGGNSILAVKLTNIINNKYYCQIKIVEVFTAKTIEKLAQLIIEEGKDEFTLINNLNTIINKPNMFMIHPAMGGSEVYITLAEELSEYYSCYGIDNYNLNNRNKINNLTQLAKLYLSSIDKVQRKTYQSNQPYILLGWSFGGQIALEIAGILEQRGVKNIQIILLDTVLVDKQLVHLLNESKEDRKILYSSALINNYLENYTEKLLNNFECEESLVYQTISNKLCYSKIILFKATKYANKSIKNHDNINIYVANLSLNNVDNYVKNIENIELVKFNNVEHNDVFKQTKFICQNLLTWFKRFN